MTLRSLSLALGLLALVAGPAVAQQYHGTLEPTDASYRDGHYMDEYRFDAVPGQPVAVRLESSAFDTYLAVVSPSGEETVNDDFGGEQASRVELMAMEAGTWTVKVTSYGRAEEGAYALTIERGPAGRVERIEGRLDPRDEQALKGEYVDEHARELPGEGRLVVELLSYGFDGYLVVTAPSGRVWRNDDAGSEQRSRVGPVPAEAGTWRFHVTTLSAGEVGAYDLNVVHLPTAD